jgi:hypothetical protein
MFVHTKVAFERDEFIVKMETLVTGARKRRKKGTERVDQSEGDTALYFFPVSSFQT